MRLHKYVRDLAARGHDAALPHLLERACKLGFKELHLHTMLRWIRDKASIIIHLDLDRAIEYLETDTHYRNQFETGTSGGLLNGRTRDKWEHDLFGGRYDACHPFHRVKYGVMNVFNDPRGYVRLRNFGDSYLLLRGGVRHRCTLSPEDSGECAGGKRLEDREVLAAARLALPEFYAHVAMEYSDEELQESLRAANAKDVHCGDTSKTMRPRKYKEVQIHGEVDLGKHVERLVANERHWPMEKRLQELCKRHGWTLGWIDTERSYIEASSQAGVVRSQPSRWKRR
eukprot:TRINITY_DN30606_c0_g1_i1.p1 TRINITY_DN30606_c0_g1~~TRINITY_DN30606_c0_g1_i1.p1  ORF type:complete len:285 (+),score=25.38 TRINITY_DN30606_c0_g1_i1:413-1267(+)